VWLVNRFYGTHDRMAEIYDRLMFHGATYADLERRGLPLIAVNATDIAYGISFSFTQPYFDLLCSDLSSFPVARAVAASNGFPVLFSPTRRVLVLSVDGQSAADPSLPKQRVVTGLGQIFGAVSGTQIDAYNFETLILTDGELRRLVEKIRTARCAQSRVIAGHDCADVRGALVHISLAGIPDPELRQRLQAIPTGLTIADAEVEALIAAGEQLVQQNAKIRELISGLDSGAAVAKAAPAPRSRARR
jgi:hypothetical protein